MSSSQSLTQLDSVTWHVTRASLVFPQGASHACDSGAGRTLHPLVIPQVDRAHHPVIPGPARPRCVGTRLRLQDCKRERRRRRAARAPWMARVNRFALPKKQTAAPEGAAVWEPPFLTRKMLRDTYQHDACQVACINRFRRRFPLEKLVRIACRRVLRIATTAGSAALLPPYGKCRAGANPPSAHQWRHPRLRYQGSERPLWHNARL